MPTYRRYVPPAPAVRDLRRQGGNDDARARTERANVTTEPLTPEPTREPEPTAPDIAPEASPAAEKPKRGRGRPRKADKA